MRSGASDYNSFAKEYARVLDPYVFRKPAVDLVSMLNMRPEHDILDVGAGSGAHSRAILRGVGQQSSGIIVALDQSMPMLHQLSDLLRYVVLAELRLFIGIVDEGDD